MADGLHGILNLKQAALRGENGGTTVIPAGLKEGVGNRKTDMSTLTPTLFVAADALHIATDTKTIHVIDILRSCKIESKHALLKHPRAINLALEQLCERALF